METGDHTVTSSGSAQSADRVGEPGSGASPLGNGGQSCGSGDRGGGTELRLQGWGLPIKVMLVLDLKPAVIFLSNIEKGGTTDEER